MKRLDDSALEPADYPGWTKGPMTATAVALTSMDRLGYARPLWRILADQAGDNYAYWAVKVCAQSPDPWTKLRACVAVVDLHVSGRQARLALAEMLRPDEPPSSGKFW